MPVTFNLMEDKLEEFQGRSPAVVTFGETMIRDTPADQERLERTRQVWLSLGGSEFSVAVMVSRLGIPSGYVTRLPDNPYGWMVRDIAREQGVNVEHIVWADRAEPIGRYLYELGRTPRSGAAWYQRKYSAASRLGAGMVDWGAALMNARIFHTTGITFGLSAHSGYERNYLGEAFAEALNAKPPECLVGLDFNYRSTLWGMEECKRVMTPLIQDGVDILITTVQDMVRFYGFSSGSITPETVDREEAFDLDDRSLRDLMGQVIAYFGLKVLALTMRYPDSQEQQRWESAALDAEGHYYRSLAIRPVVLADRLGGGDAWVGGFYYGLLTEADPEKALQKGILVGDAATRLKQTLMFDLPVINRAEIQALIHADEYGGGQWVRR